MIGESPLDKPVPSLVPTLVEHIAVDQMEKIGVREAYISQSKTGKWHLDIVKPVCKDGMWIPGPLAFKDSYTLFSSMPRDPELDCSKLLFRIERKVEIFQVGEIE